MIMVVSTRVVMRYKFLLAIMISFLAISPIGLQAQSNDSTSTTQQVTKKKKKNGIMDFLFGWLKRDRRPQVKKSENKMPEPDYANMSYDELNYRFIDAAKINDLATMIKLLVYGANINGTNEHGRTALIEVARVGKFETAKWLIDRGASVNYKDRYDGNALVYATRHHKRKMVNLLIQNGARKEFDQ